MTPFGQMDVHIRSPHQPRGRKAGTYLTLCGGRKAGTYLTLCGRMRWWMETLQRTDAPVTCEECILLDFARKASS